MVEAQHDSNTAKIEISGILTEKRSSLLLLMSDKAVYWIQPSSDQLGSRYSNGRAYRLESICQGMKSLTSVMPMMCRCFSKESVLDQFESKASSLGLYVPTQKTQLQNLGA